MTPLTLMSISNIMIVNWGLFWYFQINLQSHKTSSQHSTWTKIKNVVWLRRHHNPSNCSYLWSVDRQNTASLSLNHCCRSRIDYNSYQSNFASTMETEPVNSSKKNFLIRIFPEHSWKVGSGLIKALYQPLWIPLSRYWKSLFCKLFIDNEKYK